MEVVLATLAVLAVTCLLLPLARVGVDAHHDGIMLKPALDVLSGQVLFRDTFSQYGPLTTYLHALGLWFHGSLLTLKVMSVMATIGSLVIFYASWRELLPVSLAAVSALLFGVFIPFLDPDYMIIPWSSEFAMLFQAITLYALFRVLRKGEGIWAVVVGVACAASFWFRQPVGFTLSAAVAVTFFVAWWTGWRSAVGKTRRVFWSAAAGFALVNVFMLGGIALNGALSAWWDQNILWPRRWAAAGLLGLPNIGQSFTLGSALILLAGGGVVLAPFLWDRWTKRPVSRPGLIGYYCLLMGGAVATWTTWRVWFVLPRAGWATLLPVLIVALATASVVRAVRERRAGRVPGTEFFQVSALAGVSLASLAQYYPVPCDRHVFWALAPGMAVFVYCLWRWLDVKAGALALGTMLLLAPAVQERYGWGNYILRQPKVQIDRPAVLAGMRVSEADAKFYAALDTFYEKLAEVKPEVGVALFGYDALLACPARRLDNPGPYTVTWRGLIGPNDQRLRWGHILAERPVILLHNFTGRSEELEKLKTQARYVQVWSYPDFGLDALAPEEWAEKFSTALAGKAEHLR